MLALMTVAKRKLNIDHTSALEVFLNDMRYINPRFTLLYFTYLLPSRRSPGEEMIVCTGSAAEMCGRERSRKCISERGLYSASAAVANATFRSVVDTCKLLSVADINRDGRRHGRGRAA